MRLIVPALALLALTGLAITGCSAAQPMPVPSATPTPTATATPNPASLLPLPGTGLVLDQVGSFGDDTREPTFRFAAAHIAGEGENFTFTLPEGTWLLRVSCATDASDTVDVSLAFADGRDPVQYEAYCGETPATGIVSVTTEGPEFAGGGDVTLRVQSDSRFVAAVGLVPVG